MLRCRWLTSWPWFERFDVSDFRRFRAGHPRHWGGVCHNFSGYKVPDLMWLVLQARVSALVNVQSVEAVEGELKRRAIAGD
ncbi:MAG: hypothetical protein O2856_07525 [Planctomycetota bacterium]|nr:hypothetical protein [Planctomycetota bacterium]